MKNSTQHRVSSGPRKRVVRQISLLAGAWLFLTLGLAPAQAAPIFDAASQFSLSNPNGVWSYGFRNAFASTSFTPFASSTTAFLTSGLEAWRDPSVVGYGVGPR